MGAFGHSRLSSRLGRKNVLSGIFERSVIIIVGSSRIALSLAVLFFSTLTLSSPAPAQPGARTVPGKFIVKLKPGANRRAMGQALSTNQSLTAVSRLQVKPGLNGTDEWKRWQVFRTNDESWTAEDVRNLFGADNVEYVEPDYYLEFFDWPTDSLFTEQWYLNNTGQQYLGVERIEGDFNDSIALKQGTPGEDMDMAYVYDNPPASTTRVVVAIVDSGVDPTHPELQGRFWKNPDEIPANGLDDDHNGFVDDTLGYDVSGDVLSLYDPIGDNDPTDNQGHGTHIAGIVAANADGHGVVGVAPEAEIMAVKVRPNATSAVGAAGIVYAVNAGADVINISWGTPYEVLILKDAIDFARANGVFVAIAAGNSGTNAPMYPASFEGAFAVGAGESDGHMAGFSTWGPQIDIVAPGRDILSLRAAGTDMYAEAGEPGLRIIGSDSLYYLSDGTSMAAPAVAGAAALIWSRRPDLTLDELEDFLRLGARDMIDPHNVGDSLIGPDSISGYGYLDVGNSLNLVNHGGIYFAEPIRKNRYLNEIPIKAAPIGGYTGGWALDYATGADPETWIPLGSGASLPTDSSLPSLSLPGLNGLILLRLTDDFDMVRTTSATLVSDQRLELSSPEPGSDYDYNIPVMGSVFGSDLDSLALQYSHNGGGKVMLFESTGEYFDTLIYSWNASGLALGDYTLYLQGYFSSGEVVDSVHFMISSAFAEGWPQALSGRGAISAVCADLNNDGVKEIIVGTSSGMNVFHADGQPVDGFPLPDTGAGCVPAIYDVDHDGENEIIATSANGIHVLNYDGSEVPGWPVAYDVEWLGLGYPSPTVTRLSPLKDSAIVLINAVGEVLAFDFNGDSYFYSWTDEPLPGHFAWFNSQPSPSFYFGGNSVSGADVNGDGENEVVVTYSARTSHCGVALFEGRTGDTVFNLASPHVINASLIYGSILGDLNGDKNPEIVTCGYDSSGLRTLWAKTGGFNDLPGWPVTLPSVPAWRGNYPTMADLDLDGVPEILATFMEFDIGALYIFRADGTPYISNENRPPGEAYVYPATFGIPIVANLTGDDHPEIIIRSGYIFPGTGQERVQILDYTGTPIPGWPVKTPAPATQIFSTPYAPMVDDIDGDGLVELVLVGEAGSVYIWNFDASVEDGKNTGRLFVDNINSNIYHGPVIPTDVGDDPTDALPTSYTLSQNYPNPFNPSTSISFEVPTRSAVKLEVFNVLGQIVTTLVDQELPTGSYTATFEGADYASGVYLYRLKAGEFAETKKMVLVK